MKIGWLIVGGLGAAGALLLLKLPNAAGASSSKRIAQPPLLPPGKWVQLSPAYEDLLGPHWNVPPETRYRAFYDHYPPGYEDDHPGNYNMRWWAVSRVKPADWPGDRPIARRGQCLYDNDPEKQQPAWVDGMVDSLVEPFDRPCAIWIFQPSGNRAGFTGFD